MTTETAAAMHYSNAGEAQHALPTCQHCHKPFKPQRRWQAFCGDACRTLYHSRRAKAIRDRAPVMFAAMQKIAEGQNDPIGINSQLAAEAIKGLKAP